MLRLLTVLSIFGALAYAKECGISRPVDPEDEPNRIVGGSGAKFMAYPWQISWRYLNKTTNVHRHICGASIILDEWLVTAAHCVDLKQDNTTDPSLFLAGVGMHFQNKENPNQQIIPVEKIIMHYGWDSKTLAHDIALVKLAKPIGLENQKYVNAICVGKYKDQTEGKMAVISGWGLTEDGGKDIPNELQMADVKVEKLTSCRNRYQILVPILDSHVCAGYVPGVCNGDSGGPLQYRIGEKFYLLGATSFGAGGCESKIFPGVFTRVPYYISWIQEKTGQTLPQ